MTASSNNENIQSIAIKLMQIFFGAAQKTATLQLIEKDTISNSPCLHVFGQGREN